MTNKKEAEKKSSKKAKAVYSGEDHTIEFTLDRETKGAVRFQEIDENGDERESMDDGAIGTLYLRKAFLERIGFPGVPEGCTITISFNE